MNDFTLTDKYDDRHYERFVRDSFDRDDAWSFF